MLLRYQTQEKNDEEDGERGDGDHVREDPGDAELEGVLDGGEVGEYAEDDGGGDDHYDEPEVELGFRPVVFSPALDGDDFCGDHLGGEGGE